jgi:hypothetical protein
MAVLRVRFENGHLIPLDEVQDLQEGAEFEVEYDPPLTDEDFSDEAIDEMLNHTAGLWADWPEDIEGMIEEARQIWDKLWFDNLPSL